MIERHHLSILLEVHQSGSLTAAAETLALTQSALSHSIRKLEGQLGAQLWLKEGRGLRFTPEGAFLLSVARRLLPQFERAERVLQQMAAGQRGTLRLGVECHPCQQWLLRVVQPFLEQWPRVDVDIKQRFQFGGVGALMAREIDVLVTPDPLVKPELAFEAVFDFEQVLVVSDQHRLAGLAYVEPEALVDEVLLTYPVDIDRLDVFRDFLLPAHCRPKQHKLIESTDILLSMVAAGRGVAALPDWLVAESRPRFPVVPVRMGEAGLPRQLFLGTRHPEAGDDPVRAFLALAHQTSASSVDAVSDR